MIDLRASYDQMKLILGEFIEPFESVLLVENIRQYWKPKKVKVILLAESHVFTTHSDIAIKLPIIEGLEDYSEQYAKFVYCLAYGESGLTKSSRHPKRDGTPQFLKIFYSCLNYISSNEDFFNVLKSKTPFEQRVINKVNLLKALKDKGVWLVDTSICALYHNGKKPDNYTMSKAISTSWLSYTKKVITEANPEHVIVVGRGVARNIEHELNKIMGGNYSVIDQPNAHLSAEKHLANFQKYYHICNV